MVFLLIILIILLSILTIRVRFEIINIKINSLDKNKMNKSYQIKITIYTFYKIPILKTIITHDKIKKIIKNENIKQAIIKREKMLIQNSRKLDKRIINSLKGIKLDIEEMNLKILIGTDNASVTAFLIPIISTFLAVFLSKKVENYNNKQIFSITPVYVNENLINIEFSGIFQIKMIHIINTICILSKKRKGDKYERTSNRRAYDYGYE